MAEIDDLVACWCETERRGDAAALDALLQGGFRGIGPAGFVLTGGRCTDQPSERIYRD
jgi:hypothetical protein